MRWEPVLRGRLFSLWRSVRSMATVRAGVGSTAVVVLVVGAVLAGCGGTDRSVSRGSSSTDGAGPVAGLEPPGTDMADGLVVPKGARLAGAVFATPSEVAAHDDWSAHLVIDGDPFTAWDDLAAQFRGLGGDRSAAIAGSEDACVWTWRDDAPGPGGKVTGAPIETSDGSASGAPSTALTTTEAAPVVDPYLAAVTITDQPPAAEVDGVECHAVARAAGSKGVRYALDLVAGRRWPATFSIDAAWVEGYPASAPTAFRTTLEVQSSKGGGVDPIPGPGRVPAAAAEHVPAVLAQEAPKAGGPFGTEVNCFAEKPGYDHIRLPEGARFVAGSFLLGASSVISVADASTAIADIRRQTAGDGTSEDGTGTLRTLDLASGGSVTRFAFSVGAGGGSCSATSSPDGRFVLVSVHGD